MTATGEERQYSEFLVETEWLEQHLDSPDLRVFDCTVNVFPNLDPVRGQQLPFVYQSGRMHFDESHIPHAGFIDIPGELSDTTADIPLMLPSEQQFVKAMSNYGIGDDTRVVLYSSTEPNWAARVWWLLHAFGFDNAVILNGGWGKWTAEGRPVSAQACTYVPGHFTAKPRPGAFVDKDEVLAAIGEDEIRIINALPSPIHTGASDVTFGRKGRIAGSVNVPFGSLHNPDTGGYLPADQLLRKFDEVRARNATQIITYCGGGIAAANNAFTLTMLGYNNVAVYDGSMLEWGNDASLPMEMG